MEATADIVLEEAVADQAAVEGRALALRQVQCSQLQTVQIHPRGRRAERKINQKVGEKAAVARVQQRLPAAEPRRKKRST